MYKGYKIRIFPNKEQEQLFLNHINSCRFIYNYMLEFNENYFKENNRNLSFSELCKKLVELKKEKEYEWLNKVSSQSLKLKINDLCKAYKMFFAKKSMLPKFKSKKREKLSFPVRQDNKRFYFKDDYVKIEKIGKVKLKDKNNNFKNINKFYNVRITRTTNNKWILSFSTDYDSQIVNLNDYVVGIDLGVKNLAVCSCNYNKIVFHNINKSKKIKNLENKLKYLQKIICRKYRTNGSYNKSKSILRYENMCRKIYYKLYNIRQNYIHQTTHKIIQLFPKTIVMEDLDIFGMVKNKYLSKAILEQKFYEFIRQIKYKSDIYGIKFIQVNRFYPSSQICSNCGNRKTNLRLSDRVYICEKCGIKIDRDFNAAINLMKFGIDFNYK